MNSPIYKYYNWSILLDATILIIGLCLILGEMKSPCIITLIIACIVAYIFSWWVSVIYVFDDMLVVNYPLRFCHREYCFSLSDISLIQYHVMESKASSEYMKLNLKNGKQVKILIYSFRKLRPFIVFAQSKGIDIEIKGTEHNSIDDLR